MSIFSSVYNLLNSGAIKRTEALEKIAREIGWSFEARPDSALITELKRFYLFSQSLSSRKAIFNLMHGREDAAKAALFDYTYSIAAGTATKQHYQIIVYFQTPQSDLPQFLMRPEGWT